MESNNTTMAYGFCTLQNTVNLSNPNRATRWTYTETQQQIAGILNPVVAGFGIPGNLVFLWMVFRVQALQTRVDAYLATLAVTDILYIICNSAWTRLSLVNQTINRASGFNSEFSCGFWMFAWRLFYVASLELMTLISYERYLAVCRPVKYFALKGKAGNIELLVAVWFTAIVCAIPYALHSSALKTYCVKWPGTWADRRMPKTYNVCYNKRFVLVKNYYMPIFDLFMFTLVLLLNCVLFFKIIQKLGHVAETNDKKTKLERIRIQVTKTLVANGIIFFVCQISYRFYYIDDILDTLFELKFMTTHEKLNVFLSGHVLQMINSTINPYLYVLTCQHYRKALMKAFWMDKCDRQKSGLNNKSLTNINAKFQTTRL